MSKNSGDTNTTQGAREIKNETDASQNADTIVEIDLSQSDRSGGSAGRNNSGFWLGVCVGSIAMAVFVTATGGLGTPAAAAVGGACASGVKALTSAKAAAAAGACL